MRDDDDECLQWPYTFHGLPHSRRCARNDVKHKRIKKLQSFWIGVSNKNNSEFVIEIICTAAILPLCLRSCAALRAGVL